MTGKLSVLIPLLYLYVFMKKFFLFLILLTFSFYTTKDLCVSVDFNRRHTEVHNKNFHERVVDVGIPLIRRSVFL